MRNLQVVVIGDAQASENKYHFCEQLGAFLAEQGFHVITGGGTGVMEAVSKGASQAGGLTIGILPSVHHSDANPWCKVIIPTGIGHTRNSLTALSADIIISIGGKAGTLTEMAYAWIYNKPIIAVTRFGGWSEQVSGQKIDDRRSDNIIAVNSLQELKIQLERIANTLKKV
jgi:uncharacterized protein (TIGR00725 family)